MPRTRAAARAPGPSARPFQFVGGSLALDLVNTVGNRLGHDREYLARPADLRLWASLSGLLDAARVPAGDRDTRGLRRVIQTRERLYEILLASARGRPVPRDGIAWLNRSLRACERRRHLSATKHGLAWSWTPDVTLADLVSCAVLRDAVDLLTRRDAVVLSQCAGENCGWLFLDQSPSGRRKWCSMADCGNRAKARRHYRRARAAAR